MLQVTTILFSGILVAYVLFGIERVYRNITHHFGKTIDSGFRAFIGSVAVVKCLW